MSDEIETISVFGVRLRQTRQSLGLTLQEVADVCGISRQAVYSMERGKNYPSSSMLVAISRKLNVSIDYLLDNDAPKLPPVIAGMADVIRRWVDATGAGCICITADSVRLESGLKWGGNDEEEFGE